MSIGNPPNAIDRVVAIWQDGHVSFGQRLKMAREARNLRRNGLAELAQVDSSSVTRWEKDDRSPGGDAVRKLASALKVSEHWLLTGDGPREPQFTADTITMPPQGRIALEHVLDRYEWPEDLQMDAVLSIIEKARAEALRLEAVDVPASAWRLFIERAVKQATRTH